MIKPATIEAYRLMHDGALALAEVESVGMRMDVDRLDRTIDKVGERIVVLTERLKQDDVWETWKKKHKGKANLGSRIQLGDVIYKELGYKPEKYTEGSKDEKKENRKPKVDEKELTKIDLPFVKTYLEIERLKKLQSTYLIGIKREVCNGLVHPSFNLHLVRTFRSSCDSPNFQNIPIRDKQIGKLIRRCFVPRPNHVLVEVDYSALEFKVAACFWKDAAMIEYASDSTLDIHRDMAAECYMLETDDVLKDVRFFAKNQFVFPTLYGSYYVNTSRNLWNAVESGDLKTVDGRSLYEHLKSNGITKLGRCDSRQEPVKGTFEHHVRKVEKRFGNRFPDWTKRKGQWQARYNKRGWFKMMTGFVCSGVMSRNNLMNYPIQGPAFHLLLRSLIHAVKELKGWKSKVIGQIHDSMIADVHEDELEDFLVLVKEIMTERVRKEWKWVVAPLSIEAEVSDTNWFEKKEIEL